MKTINSELFQRPFIVFNSVTQIHFPSVIWLAFVVAEALEEIRDKFRNVRSEGSFQVAYFLAPRGERLRERIQGEAYAVLRAFFDGLKNS